MNIHEEEQKDGSLNNTQIPVMSMFRGNGNETVLGSERKGILFSE
jgi:hypothetical protein